MHDGGRWRLGHRPALDGLRGIAVLLVLCAHFDNPVTGPLTGAGTIGVTVFFVLSGFLITALLLAEREHTGRVSLTGFYRRRAVRLLPALYVMVAAVVVLELAWKPLGVDAPMAVAALFYFSNWWQLAHPGMNVLSPTWSLAIEEHFYVVWPACFLLGVRWGRRGVAAVAGCGLAVSVAAVLVADGQRQEWGTLERASSLLAGCLLAVYMSGRTEGRAHPVVAAVGLGCLVPLALAQQALPIELYLLGVPAVTVAVLWSVAQGTPVRWLTGRAIRWTGSRSYAIYLWNYVLVFSLPVQQADQWAGRAVVVLPATLVLAELSWRLVERPAQRFRSGHPSGAAQKLVRADLRT